MKTVFFDIDHTLYNGYLGTDFNLFMVEQGYAGREVTAKEDQLIEDFKRGTIDYREAARRALQLHADCLKGRPVDEVQKIQLDFAKAAEVRLFPWVRRVISQLQERNVQVYLISAAPVTAIEAIADVLGVQNYFGTELVVRDGQYTGELKTVLNYEEKHALIQTLISKTPGDIHIGFGDSVGDVDMLSAMDKAFVYDPGTPEMIAIARDNGWTIATEATIEGIVRAF